jgi:hypothetical protein
MTVRDALDPGESGDYPYLSTDETDGTRMPTGTHVHLDAHGRRWLVDVTPTDADGEPIGPPPA